VAVRVALLLYCLFAIVQIRQKPGLQYDEALPVLGAVHMRTDADEEFTLPHDPDTWIRIGGQWIPLMTVRYVGAIKEYLWLPLLALLGPSTASIRALSALLGLIGIWGAAFWLRANFDARVAGVVALALAINPSYVAMTVFDNGTVAIFMASLGLVCAAVALYQRRGVWWTAFLVGLAVGFGVWARVNFVWPVAAMAIAVMVVLRGKLLRIPLGHFVAAAGGIVVGCAPLIVYQIVSHGGTFEAVGMFSSGDTLGHRLYTRLVMLSECLISDREHRAMWGDAVLPWWQRGVFLPMAVAAMVMCLRRGGLRRIIAISFLMFAACLFFSGLPIAEHHLVALLPFAAALIVLAGFPRWPAVALAAFYAGCAFYWQTTAVTGLKRTGGEGPWSDGVVALAARLQQDARAVEKPLINFLDWGFQQNIYVLTEGQLPTQEVLSANTPWADLLRRGGTFVYFAPELRQVPAPTKAFLAALREAAPATRIFSVPGRDGAAYASVVDVQPDTLHRGAGTRLSTGDPQAADRLEGFYQIEQGWRWARQNFAITLNAPAAGNVRAVRLSLDLFLPDTLINALGPVTLAASANGHAIRPETFSKTGTFTFARDLPPSWLQPGPNRIEFALDKSMHARERELGLVVTAASLDALE
jgi:hypothetical protein